MSSTTSKTSERQQPDAPTSKLSKWSDKFLNGVETLGNKLPTPFTLFLILFLITALASSIMAWMNVSVIVPGSDEELFVKGLFTGEGLTWLTTNLGANYIGFPPLLTVLPILLAVGVAERSGMLAALIRKLFGSAKKIVLPYAVGVIGVTASIMADAAFVVVPPLAAMVFKAAGRHPVAGLLGSFAAVGAGYSTAIVPTSLDALFAGITNAVMETLPGIATTEVNPVSNYYFNIASSIVLGLLCGFLIDKVLEPRMWRQKIATEYAESIEPTSAADDEEISATLTAQENRALTISMWTTLATAIIVLVVVLIPGSPWRNEDGGFLPTSPLLSSVVFIVFLFFMVMGLAYGMVVGTIKNMDDVVNMMGEAIKDMIGFLVLAFILGQFVALFNWTGIGTWTAVQGAAGLEAIGLTGFPAIIAFIILASCLNLLIISGSAMWTLMAAVFVPMFALLGYEPSFIQAAFRVGDSATQVITPLNPYMIVILGLLRRYEPDAGLGTLMSRLIPFVIPFWLAWATLLAIWFYADLPLGPGSAIFLEG
ncbi:AbgT family transporter [Corynebacterium glutamicum]|uniref:p-aminobenzoyl-glutamate transporter n=1 Tax=Corynebacterium glutamicum (strain ATCC 13032 / DSM 20300 / JCM 1318 / BCRC 11384 / CCUG 27702 / LMG 3730 / NBRC 12168 / NCIMB 10025 / NRRL B-2784 / 534) TaxID=196627 RepID=Q8NU46_CORGL|nr:AbgT family transporter [Corynebacterium glutamicum]ARV65635.1 P-aminobenzoyl-glutamate transporter [Corynebacterium glutamicum]AUH99736.1 P-aminobenzoyl-glutamate transporter [Corynebacterium glutamicum]AUI03374.1 P-aminobenzoyl-glutamate transporter [Corynebacterium glutamicum]MBA4570907.1 AbgT family transporter [Corynebacterium glutamicum]MBA4573737.1 AbgT family transporter [Corynebacterium glutamicum]